MLPLRNHPVTADLWGSNPHDFSTSRSGSRSGCSFRLLSGQHPRTSFSSNWRHAPGLVAVGVLVSFSVDDLIALTVWPLTVLHVLLIHFGLAAIPSFTQAALTEFTLYSHLTISSVHHCTDMMIAARCHLGKLSGRGRSMRFQLPRLLNQSVRF
jgi:hypothetical protein